MNKPIWIACNQEDKERIMNNLVIGGDCPDGADCNKYKGGCRECWEAHIDFEIVDKPEAERQYTKNEETFMTWFGTTIGCQECPAKKYCDNGRRREGRKRCGERLIEWMKGEDE